MPTSNIYPPPSIIISSSTNMKQGSSPTPKIAQHQTSSPSVKPSEHPLSAGSTSASSSSKPNASSQMTPQSQTPPFEPCNICGNSQVDPSQTVDLLGNEVSCGALGELFASESVREGSSQCLTYRAQHFDKCCYSSAEAPNDGCNLCDAGIDAPPLLVRDDASVELGGIRIFCTDLSREISAIAASSRQCIDTRSEHFSDCWYVSENLVTFLLYLPFEPLANKMQL